jgi:Dihydrodipicolinate synthase/N-acetylneuraminate lyase
VSTASVGPGQETQLTVTPLARGVWGVLATPFTGAACDVCEASLVRAVEHYRKVGAAGLTVLGVFGEAARLSLAEQRSVVEIVAGARVDLPIVVGLPGLATRVAVEQGQAAVRAAGAGLAGLMVQVNTADPAALGAHLRTVAAETGVGIVVQDYPLVSGVRIDQADLARCVADNADIVVAVKSESPPTAPAIATLTAGLDVPVFGGLGGVGLLDELACGASGAMTGFSYPEALVATVRAFEQGGFEAARAVFSPWLPLVNFEAQPRVSLAVRKECLRARGFFTDARVRPPAPGFPEALRPLVAAHLAAADALLGEGSARSPRPR